MVNKNNTHCLDTNLSLIPSIYNNVYVCGLFVWPFSPESNPTLSLAGLAIQLSRQLNAQADTTEIPKDEARAMSQISAKTQVWLSYYGLVDEGRLAVPAIVLEASEETIWNRDTGIAHDFLVFKLDQARLSQVIFTS